MVPSPPQPSRQRRTRLDPHLKAVAERWEAGCHNIAQLHRELVAAGHTITYRNVYRQLVTPVREVPAAHTLIFRRDDACLGASLIKGFARLDQLDLLKAVCDQNRYL